MPDLTVSQLLESAGRRLREEFRHIRETNPHAGEKGSELEESLRRFLNAHLPQRFRATSGILVDFENARSRQTDVVLYDALCSPVYRASEKLQILPAHTVACVIEVKSTLTKATLRDAYEKIRSCKSLRYEPPSTTDRPATGSGLVTSAMLGIVFAYSSELTLETIGEHAVALNAEYDSDTWPDMVVVLDRGLFTYGVQWPGDARCGHFGARPPRSQNEFSPAPFYVIPLVHSDGDLTLNGFFLYLLAHLTFFPLRSGVPPFDLILGGSMATGLTLGGYQFDSEGNLRPVSPDMYKSAKPKPLGVMEVTTTLGRVVAVLELWQWQDATFIRAEGLLQLGQVLAMTIDIQRVMLHRPPSQPNVAFTSLLSVSADEFSKWPDVISSKSNLVARMRDSG